MEENYESGAEVALLTSGKNQIGSPAKFRFRILSFQDCRWWVTPSISQKKLSRALHIPQDELFRKGLGNENEHISGRL